VQNLLGGSIAIVLGAALAVFIIVRQFLPRRITPRLMIIGPAILAYFGLTGLGSLDATAVAFLTINAGVGLVLGLLRATTVRVWLDEQGQAYMRGTWATLGLWLALVVARLALMAVERSFGLQLSSYSGSYMLPVAVTLAAQNALVWLRAQNRGLARA
jgi:hypothetical protein